MVRVRNVVRVAIVGALSIAVALPAANAGAIVDPGPTDVVPAPPPVVLPPLDSTFFLLTPPAPDVVTSTGGTRIAFEHAIGFRGGATVKPLVAAYITDTATGVTQALSSSVVTYAFDTALSHNGAFALSKSTDIVTTAPRRPALPSVVLRRINLATGASTPITLGAGAVAPADGDPTIVGPTAISDDGTKVVLSTNGTSLDARVVTKTCFVPELGVPFPGRPINCTPAELFVLDLTTGAAKLLTDPTDAISESGRVRMAADGAHALVETTSALVPGDTNGTVDTYRIDTATGAATLLSAGAAPATIDSVFDDALNRYVYTAPGGAAGLSQLWVKDLTTGATILASQTAAGVAGSGPYVGALLSGDGGTLAFTTASNLDPTEPGAADTAPDLYVKNLATGVLTTAVVGSSATSFPIAYSVTADTVGYRVDTNRFLKHLTFASATPTAASICALTRQYVAATAPGGARGTEKARHITRLVDRGCEALAKGEVERFARVVRKLRGLHALTAAQATELVAQARTLPRSHDDDDGDDHLARS